ncbi:uncharacterized protein LOC133288284 [Gastrolobium bilobum]|uniref:uncharacterized protein LOC133288284 n=1 Tax=Gastrolobium bilobum TaxID=150636 RepID=UPI002AAF607B|nr:uncharacterized protein LOC133288284 [Gastrolobium bilobum]
MVGQWTVTKPSRSDDVLDADEQVRIANQIRAQFDALAPKRPIKPNRSEPEHEHTVDSTVSVHNIPELHKFQSLQSRSHDILSAEGFVDAQDEFVETQYYKELASIDKQHHATGSGFIKAVIEGEGEGGNEIQLPVSHVDAGETHLTGYKSNPATNDWVPNFDEHQVFVSSKPNRSESS